MTFARPLPTTRWSLVVRAGMSPCDPDFRTRARQSLEELCEIYWPALYGYLRRRGNSRSDAEDLIQGFFANLLERESIAAADSTRGRFRAFLYTALDNYVANEHRRGQAIRRGGKAQTFSIDQYRFDDADQAIAPTEIADENMDPAVLFDRQWASCLINETMRQLADEYTVKGKAAWFERLRPLLSSGEVSSEYRRQVEKELGMTATALKVAIHRLRANYRRRLLEAVSQTLDDTDDCHSERQWLFDALGKMSENQL